MATLRPVDHHTRQQLNEHLGSIENAFDADVLTIISPILSGLEIVVKSAVEMFKQRRGRILVVLETPGGIVEVIERMVHVIRHHYGEVYFVVPDHAMSAGTVFAMAGDKIFMNYFSCLGPIDPQIEKDGKLVPALSYLNQFQRLSEKADNGTLNTAEFALLNKLDLGELYQFEQARELSQDLLMRWLSTYKFKDWLNHSSTGKPVSEDDKKTRAREIATALSDNARWHSHGRAIPRDTLRKELRVKIDGVEDVPGLTPALDEYVGLLKDYMQRGQFQTFVHTHEYF
jgi:Serine dehydrogenase proteinase